MFEVELITQGLTQVELAKVTRAAEKVQIVFNSERFKEFVLNYSYDRVWSTGPFWNRKSHYEHKPCFDSTNMTNYQIYTKIMSGSETLTPAADKKGSIYLQVDRRNKRGVIGYTYPTTKWQYVYGWVLKEFSIDLIAGNLAHELMHKYGWSHSYYNTPTRQHSVPYAIGNYVANFKY